MIRQPEAARRRSTRTGRSTSCSTVGADTFKLQFPDGQPRASSTARSTSKTAYEQFLDRARADARTTRASIRSRRSSTRPRSAIRRAWKIVAFRPRIDKAWTELRVVYQAINAPEPVFAMFRLRPVVEYVPALPRPDEERDAQQQDLPRHGRQAPAERRRPSAKLDEGRRARTARRSPRSMTERDDVRRHQDQAVPRTAFVIGIALEARMGGGSARNADGSYKSGDGWGWSAHEAVPDQRRHDAGVRRTSRSPASGPRRCRRDDGKTLGAEVRAAVRPGRSEARRRLRGAVPQDAWASSICPDDQGRQGRQRQASTRTTCYVEHKQTCDVEKLAARGRPPRSRRGERHDLLAVPHPQLRHARLRRPGERRSERRACRRRRTTRSRRSTSRSSRHADWEAFTLEFLAAPGVPRQDDASSSTSARTRAKGLTCPLAK